MAANEKTILFINPQSLSHTYNPHVVINQASSSQVRLVLSENKVLWKTWGRNRDEVSWIGHKVYTLAQMNVSDQSHATAALL